MTMTVEVCLLAAGRTIAAILSTIFRRIVLDDMVGMSLIKSRFYLAATRSSGELLPNDDKPQLFSINILPSIRSSEAEPSVSTAELVPYTAKETYKIPLSS